MANAADILSEFVLEKLSGESLTRRAQVYRALAGVSAPERSKRLETLAAECDAIQAAHEQLIFDFSRRVRGGSH